jgi:hypothetical protein
MLCYGFLQRPDRQESYQTHWEMRYALRVYPVESTCRFAMVFAISSEEAVT